MKKEKYLNYDYIWERKKKLKFLRKENNMKNTKERKKTLETLFSYKWFYYGKEKKINIIKINKKLMYF